MNKLHGRFFKKSQVFRSRAEHILSQEHKEPWEPQYLSYTLLSDTWQTWCGFCRDVLVASCTGTVLRDGTQVPARPFDNHVNRISKEVQHINQRGCLPNANARHSFIRQHPTWGDQGVLVTAIPHMNIHNSASLLAGFGMSIDGVRHIQKVRNACAHINGETMADVNSIRISYVGGALSHPIDLMWRETYQNQEIAYFSWLSDLEVIARAVT